MPRDFYPRREADIVDFTRNFSERLSADPQHFGATEPMALAYAALVAAFKADHFAVSEKAHRTMALVLVKDRTKRALETETRKLVRLARATADVSAEELEILGIPVRAGGRGSRIGQPDLAPMVGVLSVTGQRVTVQLRQEAGSLRADKPRGVASAVLFASIGDQPPKESAEWQFVALTSNPTFEVNFDQPDLQPGTKVWLVARWANPRGQMGPTGYPVCAYLQYVTQTPNTRLAA